MAKQLIPSAYAAANVDTADPGPYYTAGGAAEPAVMDMKRARPNGPGDLWTRYGPQPRRSFCACKDRDPCAAGWAHSPLYYNYANSLSGHMPGNGPSIENATATAPVQSGLIRNAAQNDVVFYQPALSFNLPIVGTQPPVFAPQVHYGPMIPSQLALAVLGAQTPYPSGGA